MSDSSPELAHFNADTRAAALAVPTLTIGGLRYRGRILSAAEWLPWYERYLELAKKDGKSMTVVRERLAFYRAYMATVFPRHTLRFWAPDPARLLERQPGNMLAEAFTAFFSLQLSAIVGAESEAEPTEPPSPAPGNTSSGSTPPGPDAARPTGGIRRRDAAAVLEGRFLRHYGAPRGATRAAARATV
jgi:hypothetical protein